MHKSWVLLRISTSLAVFGLAVVLLTASGAEPLTHEDLAKLVLTVDEVRSILEQEDWVVRSPAEPLLFEPEGSITAAAIYSNEKLNNRLLQIALFYFETEELAKEFFAKPRGGAEEIQEESTQQAQEALTIDQESVDEVKVAIATRAQHRFLLFRWGRFVARFEIDASQVFNQQDVTDEKLIKLAKAQFHILLNGR